MRTPAVLTRLIDLLARLAGAISRSLTTGSGGVLPGRVALACDRDALRRLAHGRDIVLVSGTNGKTTTTRLIAAALASRGPVVTNDGGANLESGLVTALLSSDARIGVLEVDEVVLPRAIAATTPAVVVLLNLSRDQLDRTFEVSNHVRRWAEGLVDSWALVVANADDPLVVCAVTRARPDLRDVIWVAAGQSWRADVPLCPRCGAGWEATLLHWSCAQCGLRRPEPTWAATSDTLLTPRAQRLPLHLKLPGALNAGNAAMAVAAADAMGVAPEQSLPAVSEIGEVAGRYLHVVTGKGELELVLAKNPAGWLAALDDICTAEGGLMLAINARTADGTDPSWLWDVAFEGLAGRTVVVTGERALDLSTRLYYAEVEHTVRTRLADALEALPPGRISILANYTAFVQLRRMLAPPR